MSIKKCRCGQLLNEDGTCDVCDNRPDLNEDVPFADKIELDGN